jgi:hypothetical protein
LKRLRWPRFPPTRSRLRLSRIERPLLEVFAVLQLVWLWAWGICCWRLGTLLISTAFLMIVLHNWRDEP